MGFRFAPGNRCANPAPFDRFDGQFPLFMRMLAPSLLTLSHRPMGLYTLFAVNLAKSVKLPERLIIIRLTSSGDCIHL